MTTLAFGFELLSPMHLLLLGVVMLLIFGRRLPEVGRNLGRGITEFKKGLKDVQTHADDAAASTSPPQQLSPPQTASQPFAQPFATNQPRAYVSEQSGAGTPRLQPPAVTAQSPARVTRQDMVD